METTFELRRKLLNLIEKKKGKSFLFAYMQFQVINPIANYDDPVWLSDKIAYYADMPDYVEVN